MSRVPLVLIVDDARDNREAYAEYLRFRGFQTLEAATGSEALQQALAQRPDVILLDLRLPDIDGLEVSKYVRATPDLRHSKIIAVSAAVYPADMAAALASGCDAFLQKPCPPDLLVAEIARLLASAAT
jgi:hypothetical protein